MSATVSTHHEKLLKVLIVIIKRIIAAAAGRQQIHRAVNPDRNRAVHIAAAHRLRETAMATRLVYLAFHINHEFVAVAA